MLHEGLPLTPNGNSQTDKLIGTGLAIHSLPAKLSRIAATAATTTLLSTRDSEHQVPLIA